MSQDEGKEQQPQPPKFKPVKVQAGGQEIEFTPADDVQGELAKGYMRQGDYTRKMQELAKMRETVQREATYGPGRGPQTGVPAGYGGPGGLAPPGTVGGAAPWRGQPTYPAQDQPPYGTPTPNWPGPLYPDDSEIDDVVTKRDLQRMMAHIQYNQAQEVQQMREAMARQQETLAEERTIDTMSRDPRLPGFTRDAVEEVLWQMNDAERGYYERMPKSAAYRLIYHQNQELFSPQTSTPQGGGEPAAPGPERPPYMQGARTAKSDLEVSPNWEQLQRMPDSVEKAGAVMAEIRRLQETK